MYIIFKALKGSYNQGICLCIPLFPMFLLQVSVDKTDIFEIWCKHRACKDFTTFLTVITSTTMTGMQIYEMIKTLISFSV
jgi:hypothetical protein